MTPHPSNHDIIAIDRVEIAVEPWSWPFASARRDEIDRHFAALRRERPALWNGRVLLLNHYAIGAGVLRGACFETDYASFIAWREWNFPDPGVFNFFAAAALRAADGAYLVGEMAPYTAAAGLAYFPCGTPEPGDVLASGAFDLPGNLRRELLEETGIAIDELDAEAGWSVIRDRGYVAMIKRLTARQNADALRSRVMRHLATDAQPEFTDIRIVRGRGDLDARMPPFVVAFLEREWRR
jgi:hypothetical protein